MYTHIIHIIIGDGLELTEEERDKVYMAYRLLSLLNSARETYGVNEEFVVETKIDELVNFINIRGNVGIKETARALTLEGGQVEKFAELLEKEGLIEIKYGIRGLFLQMPKIKRN